jgi:hypothetical protein
MLIRSNTPVAILIESESLGRFLTFGVAPNLRKSLNSVEKALRSAHGAMCREMDVALAVERLGLPVAAATSVVPFSECHLRKARDYSSSPGGGTPHCIRKPREYLVAIWRRTLFV